MRWAVHKTRDGQFVLTAETGEVYVEERFTGTPGGRHVPVKSWWKRLLEALWKS